MAQGLNSLTTGSHVLYKADIEKTYKSSCLKHKAYNFEIWLIALLTLRCLNPSSVAINCPIPEIECSTLTYIM